MRCLPVAFVSRIRSVKLTEELDLAVLDYGPWFSVNAIVNPGTDMIVRVGLAGVCLNSHGHATCYSFCA